jgi:uncharacterized protein (TIGR02453 family)
MAAYFTPELFKFLRELAKHNDRGWFQKNKERYEKEARDPFLKLIGDLGPLLARVSRHFVADPRPTGGSMMRIYRDTRFSKDKSPFKTAIAAHFEHRKAEPGAAPGFYLHLEPGKSATGSGLWRPEPKPLKQIRDAIAADTRGWQKAVDGRSHGSACGMMGESLKKPPAGYDPNHPFVEDLKRKDFALRVELTDEVVCSAGFLDEVVDAFEKQSKFVQFLSKAVGLPF